MKEKRRLGMNEDEGVTFWTDRYGNEVYEETEISTFPLCIYPSKK